MVHFPRVDTVACPLLLILFIFNALHKTHCAAFFSKSPSTRAVSLDHLALESLHDQLLKVAWTYLDTFHVFHDPLHATVKIALPSHRVDGLENVFSFFEKHGPKLDLTSNYDTKTHTFHTILHQPITTGDSIQSYRTIEHTLQQYMFHQQKTLEQQYDPRNLGNSNSTLQQRFGLHLYSNLTCAQIMITTSTTNNRLSESHYTLPFKILIGRFYPISTVVSENGVIHEELSSPLEPIVLSVEPFFSQRQHTLKSNREQEGESSYEEDKDGSFFSLDYSVNGTILTTERHLYSVLSTPPLFYIGSTPNHYPSCSGKTLLRQPYTHDHCMLLPTEFLTKRATLSNVTLEKLYCQGDVPLKTVAMFQQWSRTPPDKTLNPFHQSKTYHTICTASGWLEPQQVKPSNWSIQMDKQCKSQSSRSDQDSFFRKETVGNDERNT